MNFFDGFRTSHELSKPAIIPYEAMHQLVPWDELNTFRNRGLNPNRPHSRQLGQFQDTFFQNSEAINKYYDQTPAIVQETMNDVGYIVGRNYKIFTYKGVPDAEHVGGFFGWLWRFCSLKNLKMYPQFGNFVAVWTGWKGQKCLG